jgi:hypothetical protein
MCQRKLSDLFTVEIHQAALDYNQPIGVVALYRGECAKKFIARSSVYGIDRQSK